MLFQQALVLFLGFVHWVDLRRPLREMDLVAFPHARVLAINIHVRPSGVCCGSVSSVVYSAACGVGSGGAFALTPFGRDIGFSLRLGFGFRRLRGRDGRLSLGESLGDHAPGILRVFDEAGYKEVAERRVERCREPALASGSDAVAGLGSALASG